MFWERLAFYLGLVIEFECCKQLDTLSFHEILALDGAQDRLDASSCQLFL